MPTRISTPTGRTAPRRNAPALDRASGTVEGDEKSVAGGVDLATSKALELAPHDPAVRLEHLTPAPIAQLGGELRRADDVRKEHGRELPVGRGRPGNSGQKAFGLAQDRLRVADEPEVIDARYFDELRPWDVLGEIPPVLDAIPCRLRPVQHECRGPDARQDVTNVDLPEHLSHRKNRPGARADALVAGPPPTEGLVADAAGSDKVEEDTPTPSGAHDVEHLVLELRSSAPRIVGRPRESGEAVDEDEA
jgi:hypothetical protein